MTVLRRRRRRWTDGRAAGRARAAPSPPPPRITSRHSARTPTTTGRGGLRPTRRLKNAPRPGELRRGKKSRRPRDGPPAYGGPPSRRRLRVRATISVWWRCVRARTTRFTDPKRVYNRRRRLFRRRRYYCHTSSDASRLPPVGAHHTFSQPSFLKVTRPPPSRLLLCHPNFTPTTASDRNSVCVSVGQRPCGRGGNHLSRKVFNVIRRPDNNNKKNLSRNKYNTDDIICVKRLRKEFNLNCIIS